MGSTVETLCGQACGAHKYEMLGSYLRRSTIFLMVTGILVMFIYIFSKQLLLFLGGSTSIASQVAIFVYDLIPQIFAYAANFPIQKFLQSQSVVNPSTYMSAAFAVHLLLSGTVIYKLGLGLFGASLLLSFSWFSLYDGSFLKLSTASMVMLCWENRRNPTPWRRPANGEDVGYAGEDVG